MKAIRIHEHGGVGTLKLELQADHQVPVRIHDAGVAG
jgi:hypothetical protein